MKFKPVTNTPEPPEVAADNYFATTVKPNEETNKGQLHCHLQLTITRDFSLVDEEHRRRSRMPQSVTLRNEGGMTGKLSSE